MYELGVSFGLAHEFRVWFNYSTIGCWYSYRCMTWVLHRTSRFVILVEKLNCKSTGLFLMESLRSILEAIYKRSSNASPIHSWRELQCGWRQIMTIDNSYDIWLPLLTIVYMFWHYNWWMIMTTWQFTCSDITIGYFDKSDRKLFTVEMTSITRAHRKLLWTSTW